jgi:preprotein translocase subunit Sec61beta
MHFGNMANEQINTPGGFGGLMRFNEEYSSIFNLKPTHVIVFVIMIVVFRIFLEVIY